jgi:hypothetical protein
MNSRLCFHTLVVQNICWLALRKLYQRMQTTELLRKTYHDVFGVSGSQTAVVSIHPPSSIGDERSVWQDRQIKLLPENG